MEKLDQQRVEDNYNKNWKEIIENEDGSINKKQLMLELSDFSDMIQRVTELTCLLTGDVLSYPTYKPSVIVEFHNEVIDRAYKDGYNDAQEELGVE